MNDFKLVGSFILRRPVTWLFHALSLAVAIAVLGSVLLIQRAADTRLKRDLAGVDLVVGAKGSPLQLVMSSLFHVDAPTGNILLSQAETIRANRLVRSAIPISLGDNVGGVRIVGTEKAFGTLYGAELSSGRWWDKTMEAVIGAEAAERLSLGLGDTFVGDHGLMPGGQAHRDARYKVTGILAPTGAVIDRLVLTDLASVWAIHENHHHDGEAKDGHKHHERGNEIGKKDARQITALLVQYQSPLAAAILPGLVSATPDLQPASPAREALRLTALLGAGSNTLTLLGTVLLALAAFGFIIALASAVASRRRELALLGALGASQSHLLRLTLIEGLVLGSVGGAIGIAFARLAAASIAATGLGGYALPVESFGQTDLVLWSGAVALGLLGAVFPGLVAARTDIVRSLGGGA